MVYRVIQISDTHLGVAKPFFVDNFDVVARALHSAAPDLVVNTGDISLNGAELEEDLRQALARHVALDLPVRFLPGNHDIGDNQPIARHQPINPERLARYLSVFGEDRWVIDVPGWRLIGINALLPDSDLPRAVDQQQFLTEAVASAGDRAIALFLHKPMFKADPGETEIGGEHLTPVARARVLSALGDANLKLVACGHLHQYRDATFGGVRHIWAPATSFILSDRFQRVAGIKTVGYVAYDFSPDGGCAVRLVEPAGLVTNDLVDFPEAYGDLNKIMAHRLLA